MGELDDNCSGLATAAHGHDSGSCADVSPSSRDLPAFMHRLAQAGNLEMDPGYSVRLAVDALATSPNEGFSSAQARTLLHTWWSRVRCCIWHRHGWLPCSAGVWASGPGMARTMQGARTWVGPLCSGCAKGQLIPHEGKLRQPLCRYLTSNFAPCLVPGARLSPLAAAVAVRALRLLKSSGAVPPSLGLADACTWNVIDNHELLMEAFAAASCSRGRQEKPEPQHHSQVGSTNGTPLAKLAAW